MCDRGTFSTSDIDAFHICLRISLNNPLLILIIVLVVLMEQRKILFVIGVSLVISGLIWENYVLPEVISAPESLNFDIFFAKLWGELMLWSGAVLLIISGIVVYRMCKR